MHGYNGSDGAFVGYSWGLLSVSPCCFKISFVELCHHHVYGVKTKVLSAHELSFFAPGNSAWEGFYLLLLFFDR